MNELLQAAGAIKEVARNAAEAREQYPTAFALDALAAMLLQMLFKRAMRCAPPDGLRDDLSNLFGTRFTDEQTQKIREFVLKREIAREGE